MQELYAGVPKVCLRKRLSTNKNYTEILPRPSTQNTYTQWNGDRLHCADTEDIYIDIAIEQIACEYTHTWLARQEGGRLLCAEARNIQGLSVSAMTYGGICNHECKANSETLHALRNAKNRIYAGRLRESSALNVHAHAQMQDYNRLRKKNTVIPRRGLEHLSFA